MRVQVQVANGPILSLEMGWGYCGSVCVHVE